MLRVAKVHAPHLTIRHGTLTVYLDAHGGALVNLIHGYADNGDPFVRKFTDQLLGEVWFISIFNLSGELIDAA